MTLREILANRARRYSRIAESKKRTSARERRRINHLIESRENLRRRNHYILVEDENEDDLVEIEPDDTGTDTTGAEGEDMSKDEIVNTLKTLAAELGLKVIPDDAEGDEGDEGDAEDDEGAKGDEPAESTDAQPAAPATNAQPADQNAQPTNEADDKDDEAADAPADVPADAPADGTVDAGEGDAPADDAEGDASADDAEGDDVPADDEKKEDVGEIAKKMAEMTRDDWEGLLAQVL